MILSVACSIWNAGELDGGACGGLDIEGLGGDLTGSTNPTSITMDGDKNITVMFTPNAYTLTVNSAHGAVTNDPDKPAIIMGMKSHWV